jgi:hypothetical protein
VSDDVGHSLERALVLITSGDFVAFRMAAVLLVGQKHRNLGTQLRELEGAYESVSRADQRQCIISADGQVALTCDERNA